MWLWIGRHSFATSENKWQKTNTLNSNQIELAQIKWHKTMCEIGEEEEEDDGEKNSNTCCCTAATNDDECVSLIFIWSMAFEKGCKAYEREIKLKNPWKKRVNKPV